MLAGDELWRCVDRAAHGNSAVSTVTVVVPTIPPRAELLLRALDSITAQTRYPDAITIAIDNEGEGAAPTRNRGWRAAQTDFVAFLDDDDEFLPQHLERLMEVADDADMVYSWFEHVGWPEWTPERQDALAVMRNGQLVHPLGVPFGPEQAAHMKRFAFIPITALVRKSALEKSGGFPRPLSREWPRDDCEDWGGWLALLRTGARFVHVPERTWVCHHTNDGERGTSGRPWKGAVS